jgi:hypothetical protein
MTWPDLFDITSNYHGGNAQSIEAHVSIISLKDKARAAICRLARHRGSIGLVCDEAERALGLSHQSCSARFTELKRDGLLIPTDRFRKTRSGRNARVFIVSTS